MPMKRLSTSDLHHLRAADGWLDLGDWKSANEELDEVAPARRSHVAVLQLRFRVYSAAQHWELALVVAEALFNYTSEIADTWIHRSFVLHELKRTAEAESLLLPALDRFPEEPTI